ncbi:MAG: SDR family NAD(P)-dependent oxidoreductase [Paraglaciecola sp.]|uniref:SDR family NAD(P)-dependent oxidoreductase n=1 Tax=Paraglaciecola sp. TaxID=1920173 RepID=UPI00329867E9
MSAGNEPKWWSVCITGGASGIGLHLAKMMLANGSDVAIFDIYISDEAKLELEKAKIKEAQKISLHSVDVRDAAAILSAVNEASCHIGQPDLALNVAGIQLAKTFDELSAEEFERVVSINLFGSRNFSAAVLPLMTKGSQLAFVASLAGLVPNYTYAAYCSSKFGVVALAGVLRQEYIAKGIYVSVICPPEIDTPLVMEELKTMHPVTKELKSLAGNISLEQACSEILASLHKHTFLIIPGFMARLTYWLNRIVPIKLFNILVNNIILKTLAKQQKH